MRRGLFCIVILAMAVNIGFAGCAAKTKDTLPAQSDYITDATQAGGESAQPGSGDVQKTEPASEMPPSPSAPAPAASVPSPSAQTALPLPEPSPEVSENRTIPLRVPILYYHTISDKPVGIRELSVTVADFEAQMGYLAENGYTAITFADLEHFTSFEKPVIITLDDGYSDNYTNAYPILKKYGLQATIFVISGLIDTAGYLTREEMAEMTDIVSFQGHTVNHENLTRLSPEQLEQALTVPKDTISAITNTPVYVFAYPTGYYNDAVLEAVSKHYDYAVTIKTGYYENGSDKLLIRRLYMHRDRTLERFISAIA